MCSAFNEVNSRTGRGLPFLLYGRSQQREQAFPVTPRVSCLDAKSLLDKIFSHLGIGHRPCDNVNIEAEFFQDREPTDHADIIRSAKNERGYCGPYLFVTQDRVDRVSADNAVAQLDDDQVRREAVQVVKN